MIKSPLHPLYANDELVRLTTEQFLADGHTVFQLWLLDPDEREHSVKVLEAIQLPILTEVLSLGCGVGGMERYWRDARPDLTFTLLNQSRSQLDMCVCPGDRVHILAENYYPWFSHKATLAAYMLGHVHAREVLERALEYTAGPVVVLDVFDSSPEFNSAFIYNAPTSGMMKDLGFTKIDVGPWVINPYIGEELGLGHLIEQTTPQLWISE